MTGRKITLEEVCEAWRHGQRGKASGHLPTSTLFDLIQQSLDGDEKLGAFQHLVGCTACLDDLRAMMKIRGTVLIVEMPLARVAKRHPAHSGAEGGASALELPQPKVPTIFHVMKHSTFQSAKLKDMPPGIGTRQ